MFQKSVSVLLSILMVISMGLCLCACDTTDSDNFPVTINNVTIDEEPENIVILSSEHADIISYIGYDVKMVGKSSECDHEYFERVPSVGFEASPDAQTIIDLEADLVITKTALDAQCATTLKEAGINVLTIDSPKKFSETKSMYETLGKAIGGNVTGKEKGAKAYDDLMKVLKEFNSYVPKDIITTACYLYVDDNNNLCTFTTDSLEFNTFSYCGAKNTFVTQKDAVIDLEQLKFGTPTYIFYDDERVLNFFETNSELASMSAYKNGNMMQIKKSEFLQLGITFYDTIYQMMDFMFFEDEATPDEATPDDMTQAATQTPTAGTPSSEQVEENFTIE